MLPVDEDRLITCVNGSFDLPERFLAKLRNASTTGFVYLRQDEDLLTISPSRIMDGRRRSLTRHFRAVMFRTATKLAVIEESDSIRIMAVQWRGGPRHS